MFFWLLFPGMFAAAHYFKTEWVVVKGIKDFVNETQYSSEKWKQIACVMAASVVAEILNDPVMFQDWPHLSSGIASCLNLSFLISRTDLIWICLHVHITNQRDLHNSLNKHPLFNKHLP